MLKFISLSIQGKDDSKQFVHDIKNCKILTINQKRTVSDRVPFSEKMGYSHDREADANE